MCIHRSQAVRASFATAPLATEAKETQPVSLHVSIQGRVVAADEREALNRHCEARWESAVRQPLQRSRQHQVTDLDHTWGVVASPPSPTTRLYHPPAVQLQPV